MTVALPALVTPQPPPIGSLVYLAGYLVKLALSAEITPPDTPNLYSGEFTIMDDHGEVDLTPLAGPQGFTGKADFPLRRQLDPSVIAVEDLPTTLTNTLTDKGKYWQIATLDDQGLVTGVESWVWYGTSWRMFQIGIDGPPGPVPLVQPEVTLIEPQEPPVYPDHTSYVTPSGPRLEPTWEYGVAVPQGPPGPVSSVWAMPDVDFNTNAPQNGDLLAASGFYTIEGLPIFKPLSRRQFATQFYSMPEGSFSAYIGISQRAAIGSYAVPPQPWPWTPIVWGHLGAGGLMLSANPLMIGCEVLLGDPDTGTLISRGLGNTLGEVNIMPHYSESTDLAANITPTNRLAVVPPNHSSPAQGTVYINLWNDGALGFYDFQTQGAQLFLQILPLERGVPILSHGSAYPKFSGGGRFRVDAELG
jgi:hypothetical protein